MLVCFASLMHLLWGTLILLNGGPIHIAATQVFLQIVGAEHYQFRACSYIIAALLPLILLWRPHSIVGLLSCAPQLSLLSLSGMSAIVSITSGRYADGVLRSPLFISADQGIYILLAILYAFETLDRYHERVA